MLTAVCNKQNLESMLSVAQDLEIFREESPLFLTPDGDVDRPMDVQEAMEEHDPVDLSANEFQDATVDLDMSAAAPEPIIERSVEKEDAELLLTPE